MSVGGRTLGAILSVAGAAIGIIVALWVYTGYQDGKLERTGALFTMGIFMLVLVLPLLGAGIFFLVRGAAEQKNYAEVREQRKLLDIVKTRGQVAISDLVLELGSSTDKVKNDLYDLVGRGLFSGYVDWDKGTLYSVEASKLTELGTCPNCGGRLELGGKGVIKCPYCGAEVFLAS